MEKHSIENSPFRMTLVIDLCHGRDRDSGNWPGSRKESQRPDTPGMLQS